MTCRAYGISPVVYFSLSLSLSLGIAAVLNCKVYVNKEKKKIIDCLESQSLSEMCVCREPASTKLHVVSINRMNPQVIS